MFRETRDVRADTLKLNVLKGENGLLDKMNNLRGKHRRLQPSVKGEVAQLF